MAADADRELAEGSVRARERSYAPYSNYRVGAALRTDAGAVYEGCNVENVVLHETVCAEKVALLKAVSEGETDFDTIAICTQSSPPASPCGSCRQMLHAWGVKRVLLVNPGGESVELVVRDLLPRAFELRDFQHD